MVSGTQEAVDKAGRKSELSYQIAKRAKELKRDMEFILTGNQASVVGSSSVARTTGSVEAWLTSNVSRGAGGVSGGFSAGIVGAATDGTQRAYTEALLKNVIQSCWANGGDPATIIVGPKNKAIGSTFTGIATQYRENSRHEAGDDHRRRRRLCQRLRRAPHLSLALLPRPLGAGAGHGVLGRRLPAAVPADRAGPDRRQREAPASGGVRARRQAAGRLRRGRRPDDAVRRQRNSRSRDGRPSGRPFSFRRSPPLLRPMPPHVRDRHLGLLDLQNISMQHRPEVSDRALDTAAFLPNGNWGKAEPPGNVRRLMTWEPIGASVRLTSTGRNICIPLSSGCRQRSIRPRVGRTNKPIAPCNQTLRTARQCATGCIDVLRLPGRRSDCGGSQSCVR